MWLFSFVVFPGLMLTYFNVFTDNLNIQRPWKSYMMVNSPYQVRKLGDRHNFDKTTYLRSDGKVIKQRNTSWERAFLSAHSPLRQQIDSICRGAGVHAPLPDLSYSAAEEGGSIVDFLHLNSAGILQAKDIESIGVLLAIAVCFGWSDISAENMVLGRKNDVLVFSPVDLESVLMPTGRLADTMLTHASDLCDSNVGLNVIRAQLRSLSDSNTPAIIIGAFSSILSLLYQHRYELSLLVNKQIQEPIRLKLRPSDFYRNILSSSKPAIQNKDLIEEEIRQLNRGEIPYFFTRAGQEQLFWFDTPESFKAVRQSDALPQLKFPQLPCFDSKEDLSELTKNCVQDIVSYFWNGKTLNANHSGIEISHDEFGMTVKSSGLYAPLRST
jgi:hypothetical protein